jgi:predicted ATPase
VEVELGNFNVVIGANASGKSNFVQIFKFLRDIVNEGLEDAISYQGGIEYLRNISLGKKGEIYLEVDLPPYFLLPFTKGEKGIKLIRVEGTSKYVLAIDFEKSAYYIKNELLSYKGKFFFRVLKETKKEDLKGENAKVAWQEYPEGEITLTRNREGITSISIEPEQLPIKSDDLIPPFLLEELRRIPKDKLLFEESGLSLSLSARLSFLYLFRLGDIAIYDFDPKLSKKAIPIAGKRELEEDGNNLALVLKKILASKKNREQFLYLMRNLLPFINKMDVERLADKWLLVKLQESYNEQSLPATLISDGTINLAALIIALYFEKKPLVIIEEPERNIHPHLISKVVEMMKEASENKQIIVTTHNPEVVRYAVQDKELEKGLENLLLIYRDKEGFSHISRPADKIEVKTFLEQEIGIEELYVQNLLGG